MTRRRFVRNNLDEESLNSLRDVMIKQQIIERGITSKRTITAMSAVPRHVFLPQQMWNNAYDDSPQTIGFGQTISQPYIVALMTSQLESLPIGSKILEIGSGCGYQTAILVEMGFDVYSIEIVPELVEHSEKILSNLDLSPVSITNGDGKLGLPEIAPFSGIIAAACGEVIPENWLNQLATSGIIVAPVEGKKDQHLIRIDNTESDGLIQQVICPVRFVKLH